MASQNINRVRDLNEPLRVQKRLLQFNNLPFSMGWVSSQEYTSAFKGDVQPYTNAAHGGYYPTYGEFGKLQTSEFSATVAISFKQIECYEKVRYARFIKRQLAQSGKLWAVQNGGELIWAKARVTSINEDVDNPAQENLLNLTITFELIDGYWVLASRTRTFLCPYCPPKYEKFDPYYCFDVTDLIGQCDASGASKCYPCQANLYEPPTSDGCDWQALCRYSQNELISMFGKECYNEYAIAYSCDLEKEQFCYDTAWGHKFRLRADDLNGQNYTRIEFCSKTDLPTDMLRIRIRSNTMGQLVIKQLDPAHIKDYGDANAPVDDKYVLDKVVIGSDTAYSVGEVVTTIGYGVKAYYSHDLRNPDSSITSIEDNVSRTSTPYFQLQPGINVFEIYGNPYREDAFAYFQPIEITY